MYTHFYGFSEKPFNITPDPRFLYQTADHREALASMMYGINERKGFVSITGEVGTGKTTLIYTLLKQLNGKVKTVFIFHTNITFVQLLLNILSELEVPTPEDKETTLLRLLYNYLIERLSRDENLAIIIDESQHLSYEVMEGLRMLSNLETSTSKLLQIVLVGQPELEFKLNSFNLRQLKQRIEIKRQLRPLSHEECQEYIDHRLKLVGSNCSKIFTPEAISLICDYGKGIPRTINILCDNALLIGYGVSQQTIDANIVQEVIKDMEGTIQEKPPSLELLLNRSQPLSLNVKALPETRKEKLREEATISFPLSFLNEVMHYFKSTLHSLRTPSPLSIHDAKEVEFKKYYDSMVKEKIQNMDWVLHGLLNYIQMNTPVKKMNTIHSILEENLRYFEKTLAEKKIRIVKQFENNLPETVVHDEPLRYILMSIFQFVLLHLFPNGSIEFVTKSSTLHEGVSPNNFLREKNGKCIEVLFVFTAKARLGEPFEDRSGFSPIQREEASHLIFLLTKEVVQKNQGVMEYVVDESESKTTILLRFPAERRKVVSYQPMTA